MLKWETELYGQFLIVVQQHILVAHAEDVFQWKFHTSEVLSTKEFCLKVENMVASNTIGSPMARLAWKGLLHCELKF